MKSFKDYISEQEDTGHTDLVDEFLKSRTPKEINFYSKRDNCGPACIDMHTWAKSTKNVDLSFPIRGEFIADNVIHDKSDFTPEMKAEFSSSGLNFNNSLHRRDWLENNKKYSEDWKKIPHSWLVDKNGAIHDPSGHLQIVKNNLAKDLHTHRYTSSITPKFN